jgi:cell division protein FtsB
MYDRRKGRPRQILVSLFCLCALGYFAYHAMIGKRGLEARSRLVERSRQLEPEIRRLEAVRARLEQDVRLLNAADPDIVEELAIELLGFVRPGDRVVVLAPSPSAPSADRQPRSREPSSHQSGAGLLALQRGFL